jgi:hypothetical protein
MKTILICVALATLSAPLASAEPQGGEPSAVSAIHLKRFRKHANFRKLYLDPHKSIQPTLNPDLDNRLCSTAHDFCPGFSGDNG